ncbi:MAG: hypothetical protein ACREOB_02605, partial [Thermodesulfobacteriota bacterium]
DAKFTFTLLSSVDGKIKTLIEMGFSMRYETEKQSDDTRRLQASMALHKLSAGLLAYETDRVHIVRNSCS